MRKAKKELTVFSLSALDLFCSAMGVFMILCFILFPYYMKESPTPPAPIQPSAPPPTPVPAPEPRVRKIPAVSVAMSSKIKLRDPAGNESWHVTAFNDIDMYVYAPGPNGKTLTYNFNKRRHEGSPAIYLVDSRRGGGELWVHPAITPGRYTVAFKLWEKHNPRTAMLRSKKTGRYATFKFLAHQIYFTILSPTGKKVVLSKEFKDSQFVDSGPEYKVVEINVSEDGDVNVEELPH